MIQIARAVDQSRAHADKHGRYLACNRLIAEDSTVGIECVRATCQHDVNGQSNGLGVDLSECLGEF
eukprot:5481723-Prymnesium_polylepis.1